MPAVKSKESQSEQHHLSVGTEVSAKYRGAFCEARIKGVKKTVVFRVNRKDGNNKNMKSYDLSEDCIRGSLRLGSVVEAQFPDHVAWAEGIIMSAKDKSVYTVEFDDGDIRTLTRGQLCIQGVRHFAESDTLNHLPLTDPENFGTPVLNTKRKPKRRPSWNSGNIYDTSTDDRGRNDDKASNTDTPVKRRTTKLEQDFSNLTQEERRKKLLAEPLLGKVVLVEQADKRKHWYPALCVNPQCTDDVNEMQEGQIMVRSFRTGKFSVVPRCEPLNDDNLPEKVESAWKDVVDAALLWNKTGVIPSSWRVDVNDVIEELFGNEEEEGETTTTDEQEMAKKRDFFERLYKMMDDRGSPILKTPILGYKDLDLHLLYNLVLDKGGYYSIKQPAEWREVYQSLLIPKINNASAHHVKNAYIKYLLPYEEYNSSFKNTTHAMKEEPSSTAVVVKKEKARSGRATPDSETGSSRQTSNRRRKLSETVSVSADDELPRSSSKRGGKKIKIEANDEKKNILDEKSSSAENSIVGEDKAIDEDFDVTESDKQRKTAEDKKPTIEKRRNSVSSSDHGAATTKRVYMKGDKIRVKYGRHSFKLYNAKVVDIEVIGGKDVQYYVHYTGWNSRHDEWIQPWQIAGDTSQQAPPPMISSTSAPSPPPSASTSTPGSSHTKRPKNADKKKQPTDTDKEISVTDLDDENSNSSTKSTATRTSADKATKAGNKKQAAKARVRRCSSSSTPVTGSDLLSVEKRAASEEKVMASEMGSNETPLTSSSTAKDTAESSNRGGRDSPDFLTKFPTTGRRVSSRRSKSPAQLKDILYGAKRPRRSSASSLQGDTKEELNTASEIDDSASESSRSTSNMSSSGNPSPLTLWRENDLGTEPPKICDKPAAASSSQKTEEAMQSSSSPATRHNQSSSSDSTPQPSTSSTKDTSPTDTAIKTALVIAATASESSNEISSSTNKKETSSDSNDKQKTAADPSPSTSTTNGTSQSSPQQPSTSSAGQDGDEVGIPPIDRIGQELSKEEEKCYKASTSKILTKNTPPTTDLSPNPYISEDMEATSANDTSQLASTSATSGGETSIPPLSTATTTTDHNKNNITSEITTNNVGEKESEHVNGQQRKRRRKNTNERSSNKSNKQAQLESESEEELSKSQTKKRKKKKPKPDIPCAPPPLKPEVLASMTSEERIKVLHDHLTEMRRVYQQLKQEVQSIDRKRKRAKRRDQEAAEHEKEKKASSSSPPHKKQQPSSPTTAKESSNRSANNGSCDAATS